MIEFVDCFVGCLGDVYVVIVGLLGMGEFVDFLVVEVVGGKVLGVVGNVWVGFNFFIIFRVDW